MASSSVLMIMCGLLRDGSRNTTFFFFSFSLFCNIMRLLDESWRWWIVDV